MKEEDLEIQEVGEFLVESLDMLAYKENQIFCALRQYENVCNEIGENLSRSINRFITDCILWVMRFGAECGEPIGAASGFQLCP